MTMADSIGGAAGCDVDESSSRSSSSSPLPNSPSLLSSRNGLPRESDGNRGGWTAATAAAVGLPVWEGLGDTLPSFPSDVKDAGGKSKGGRVPNSGPGR